MSYVAYVPPWSVTADDRRQRAKQYWPPTLHVGGPVIMPVGEIRHEVSIGLVCIWLQLNPSHVPDGPVKSKTQLFTFVILIKLLS